MRALRVAQPHLLFFLNILKALRSKIGISVAPYQYSEIAIKFQPPFLEIIEYYEGIAL
jgi:hypothetical protein